MLGLEGGWVGRSGVVGLEGGGVGRSGVVGLEVGGVGRSGVVGLEVGGVGYWGLEVWGMLQRWHLHLLGTCFLSNPVHLR